MKIVQIIQPLVDPHSLPFLHPIFKRASEMGYSCLRGFRMPSSKYLNWLLTIIIKVFSFPLLLQKQTIHLVFVCGWKVHPMCFPSAYRHEIIPIIWDCWPRFRSNIWKLIKLCNTKIIIFTQKQNADYFQQLFPNKKILFLPEAIITENYIIGEQIKQRPIDILEFGRTNPAINQELNTIPTEYKYLHPQGNKKLFSTHKELAKAISQAKIVICYPRSITHPEEAGEIETLTQRYWECMYSGTLMIGKAPKELIDIIGYNPVIESPINKLKDTITRILPIINDFQSLADKNKRMACIYGDWKSRFIYLEETLKNEGYILKKTYTF